jgi:hypothetical protein
MLPEGDMETRLRPERQELKVTMKMLDFDPL